MNKINSLIEMMAAQKSHYVKLLELSEALCARPDSQMDSAGLVEFLSEREILIEKIKSSDSQIERLLANHDSEKLLNHEQTSRLREEIIALVSNTMEADNKCMKLAEKAKGTVLKELGKLSNVKKTVSGYGKIGKPVYARFIDIKK